MHIKYKNIVYVSLALLVVPIFIFFLGWLRFGWGLLFSGLLVISTFFAAKILTEHKKNEFIDIPINAFIIVILVLMFWVFMAGTCGVGVGHYDVKWRTAMLRDLINHPWPVYYDNTNSYFVYYHAFWMISALVGKVFGMQAAFLTQYIYMCFIVFNAFLLISKYVQAKTKTHLYLVLLFLIGWSGLNCLGSALMEMLGMNLHSFGLHINEAYCDALFNGESFNFYYRSNQDLFTETYNQVLVWLVVPLTLLSKDIRVFAYLGLILLPFSPWGTFGVAIIMLLIAIPKGIKLLKEKRFGELLRNVFSIPNVGGILSCAFVFIIFFKSSSRLDGNHGATFGILTLSKFDLPRIIGIIIFWICEFGIYYLITWKKYKSDYLYKAILPFLMLIPLGWIGTIQGRDFCMNVSYPFLFVLMIYVIRYVKEDLAGKNISTKNVLVIICLFIAFCSPLFDMMQSTKYMIQNKSFIVQDDSIYSYDDKPIQGYENFLNDTWQDSIFFRKLAKNMK